jgi:thiopurine S-methyltransferase
VQPEFWHDRWASNRIGFHTPDVNENLKECWSELNAGPLQQVFVPLCGKSLDTHWLRKQGHRVIGVELSEIAVQALFTEHQIDVSSTANVSRSNEPDGSHGSQPASLVRYQAPHMEVYCGDFFDMTPDLLNETAFVYDRGSLVALPEETRPQYARHMEAILPPQAKMMVVTLEYLQDQMSGPPFAIHPEEVQRLYGEKWSLDCLRRRDILAAEPHFQKRGLTALNEVVYLLTRNEDSDASPPQ